MALTRRQKELLDYLGSFIEEHGYAPTIQEMAEHFSLSSVATVHKHLANLEAKGLIRREWNRSRAIELVPSPVSVRAVELPLLGRVAAGTPIEAISGMETVYVPEDMLSRRSETYVLQVRGDSMIEEQIRDGDYVIVENRQTASDGEMVIALLEGENVTLKKLFREKGRIRLQPANSRMRPIYVKPRDLTIQGVVIGVLRKY